MNDACPLKFQAKTWAQTNFKNTKKSTQCKRKSQKIHEEILPILERVFEDVKLIDNIGGFSMEYVVTLVTRTDIDAVQKSLKPWATQHMKRYRPADNEKIGTMLVVGFSTNDR